MWRTSANAVLPAHSWLKSNQTSSGTAPTDQTRSRAQQALVSIWRTVGGALTKRVDSDVSANRDTTTCLDLESPLTEADLCEYEKLDSPRAHTPSTSSPRSRTPRGDGSVTTQLPVLSPRFSPRGYHNDDNPRSPRLESVPRITYTPPARENRRGRPRTPSPLRPNYTQNTCRAMDQNFINSAVREARGLCEALLDTDEAEEYVERHASVLNAYDDTATTLRLARANLQQNWGAVFYVPSQLKVIGWCSKQYLVIDKLTPCSTDGGPSPAMIGGVKVGDVVIGVNGKKITTNTQFVAAIKEKLMITLEVVRPDELDEITDELFEDGQEELLKEVVDQANKNAIGSLARMKRMDTRQKRVFLDACV